MDKVVAYVRRVVQKQGIFKPLFVTDIDGVLIRGSSQVQGTRQAVHQLKKQGIPLSCLTNGGGHLQAIKAHKMNQLFKEELFDGELMFMSHSPIRPHLVKYSKNGLLLITGSLSITEIVDKMGIHNYVTADQLYTIFHSEKEHTKSHPALTFNLHTETAEQVKSRVKQRLRRHSLPHTYHQWGQQINAIFALNDVNPYEKALGVIHNIFLQKKKRNIALPPYFAGHNDIAFAGGYHRPRMAFGPFNYMLQHHCQKHGFALNKHYFGKPQKAVFQYVEAIMKERYGDGCFFMVGDNPRADIKGANQMEWGSFLTQTGVHQGPENDAENPATMVVHTFKDAVDAVIKIKKQKLYL